jgi:hypothetical protein
MDRQFIYITVSDDNFLLNIGNNGHRLLSRLLGGGGGGKETISDETGFLFSLHFVYSYDFAFFNFCSLHVTIDNLYTSQFQMRQ